MGVFQRCFKVSLWSWIHGAHPPVSPLRLGDEAVPAKEAVARLYGLVPRWAKDLTIGRYTYNARTETVAEKPSFRDAWRRGQHCIVPAEAICKPDWRCGKAVPTRIAHRDGKPLWLPVFGPATAMPRARKC